MTILSLGTLFLILIMTFATLVKNKSLFSIVFFLSCGNVMGNSAYGKVLHVVKCDNNFTTRTNAHFGNALTF